MDYNDMRYGKVVINRSEWEFEYSASELAIAAETKKLYRQSRIEWWENEKEKLLVEIKESGLEISEDLATSYSNGAGNAPQLKVKPELQKKIAECHQRIQKHKEAMREYDGWAQVLDANKKSNLKLTHADWLFFFGRD